MNEKGVLARGRGDDYRGESIDLDVPVDESMTPGEFFVA